MTELMAPVKKSIKGLVSHYPPQINYGLLDGIQPTERGEVFERI